MSEAIGRAQLDRSSQERFVPLRRELGVSSFGINQMNLAPGQRGRIHRHREQEEVYLVLEGTLTLLVEGEPQEVRPHDLVRVPAQVKRQLVNRHRERCILLALGGSGDHVGRDGEAFESWDEAAGRTPQEVPIPADLDDSELA